MTDTKNSTVSSQSGALNRRSFVAGASAAGLAVATVPSLAQAGLVLAPKVDQAGLISIAGRVTNGAGLPEKRAYVEIMQHRVREWTPGRSGAAIDVASWDTPDWLGVWTDDDGVFGLHTWWAVAPKEKGELSTTPRQAEVRFHVETQNGRRLTQTLWLDANPHFDASNADDPAMLTPVAWQDRARTAQFIADFQVA